MYNINQIIDKLNTAQRQAVDQVYGPVLVLAGPGTGKTHMLTARIAHILQSDIGAEPENILCLTFTESAAVEMRNRLQQWIGPTAYRVKIMTFHGFCQWIIDTYPEVFYPLFGNQVVIDDLQKALIYRQIITIKKWEYFSSIWDDFIHQYDFLRAVSDLKRENLTPDTFRLLIPAEKERLEDDPQNFYKRKFKEFSVGDWKPQAQKRIANKVGKMMELAELWETYEAALLKAGFYDFDDLINRTVTQLKTNKNLRLDLQEKFQWILVDEYQDTNNSQNAILWQLTEGIEQPNIFAVGDDDQSIYRFQGASVANIAEFRAKFSQRLEVSLSENYRSHQNILDTAYKVVGHNTQRTQVSKSLIAHKTDFGVIKLPGQIVRAELSGRLAEISFIVETIQAQLKAGVKPDEIAILVRKNREISELARELPKFGIQVSAQVSQNIFNNSAVKQLISMLKIFSDIKHDAQFFDLLHADFLALDPEVLLRLSLDRNQNKHSIIETLLTSPHVDDKLNDFFQFFITARRDFHHCRPAVLVEKFLYESGLASFLTEKNRLEDWQHIRKFISWTREQNLDSLSQLLEYIELHTELNIPIRPDSLPADRQSVQIMTAHKSKGQEFEVVLVPGLQDRQWGNPRGNFGIALPQLSDQNFDDNDEERRLFFVALTRAKSQLYLSCATTDFSGRAKVPSQFWHELPESLVTDIITDELEAKLQSLLPVFFAQAEKTLTDGEKDILHETVNNFVWSASSLQTYLDCPRKFLYQYLYRFPRRPLPQLALGVALHQALERYLKTLPQQPDLDKNFLLTEYEHALSGQNLAQDKFTDFFVHGREILTYYYDQKLHNLGQTHEHGYELEYKFGSTVIDDLRLTGVMDKIIYLDATKDKVKIVDYKSGRPRPIKMGESYWRQLVFYNLLATHTIGKNWQVAACEIEFLTPDHNEKLGSRTWEVTATDTAQVLKELQESQQKISNLEFPMVPNLEGDPEIDYWQNFGQ